MLVHVDARFSKLPIHVRSEFQKFPLQAGPEFCQLPFKAGPERRRLSFDSTKTLLVICNGAGGGFRFCFTGSSLDQRVIQLFDQHWFPCRRASQRPFYNRSCTAASTYKSLTDMGCSARSLTFRDKFDREIAVSRTKATWFDVKCVT